MCVCYCRYCGEFVYILRSLPSFDFYLAYDINTYPIRKRDYSRVIEVSFFVQFHYKESLADFKSKLVYGGDIYVRR